MTITTGLTLDIFPPEPHAGDIITLRAGPYNPVEVDYKWSIVGAGIDKSRVQTVGDSDVERTLDTRGLPPGAITVSISAEARKSKRGRAVKEEIAPEFQPETKEFTFYLHPARITEEQVNTLLRKAESLVDRLVSDRPLNSADPGAGVPAAGAAAGATAGAGDAMVPVRMEGAGGVGGEGRIPRPPLPVTLQTRLPSDINSDGDILLWQTIRNRTNAISFNRYQEFINRVMCDDLTEDTTENNERTRLRDRRGMINSEFHGVDAYDLLRSATEAFLVYESGVFVQGPFSKKKNNYDGTANVDGEFDRLGQTFTYDEINGKLQTYLTNPNRDTYWERIRKGLEIEASDAYPGCVYVTNNDYSSRLIFSNGFRTPLLLELVWSYWHEEAMLVQTMNTINLRFSNMYNDEIRDQLHNLEFATLQPLSNLLWGQLQTSTRQLSVKRRAQEYAHEYGLTLFGKAVQGIRPVDNRSKFLEAFHNLLYLATLFFKQADDTTINADAFPLLNALREVHLILAQGAHNQFGDLPWTSRAEMLTQQWLLARHEMSEFLRARPMVPYEEGWMGTVDTMKTLQGWTDTSVSYFNRLARFGEQLLLSIRYTLWIDIDQASVARDWALYWRSEIQSYIHAYRAVTGVDLAAEATSTQPVEARYAMPSELMRKRLANVPNSDGKLNGNGKAAQLPPPTTQVKPAVPSNFRERREQRLK